MLMKKLVEIDAACSPQRKQQEIEDREKNLDEFTKEKRAIGAYFREIREDIKERDTLMKENRTQGVKKSAEIRRKLTEATQRAEDLDKMYKAKHKKLKQSEKIRFLVLKFLKKKKKKMRTENKLLT